MENVGIRKSKFAQRRRYRNNSSLSGLSEIDVNAPFDQNLVAISRRSRMRRSHASRASYHSHARQPSDGDLVIFMAQSELEEMEKGKQLSITTTAEEDQASPAPAEDLTSDSFGKKMFGENTLS